MVQESFHEDIGRHHSFATQQGLYIDIEREIRGDSAHRRGLSIAGDRRCGVGAIHRVEAQNIE